MLNSAYICRVEEDTDNYYIVPKKCSVIHYIEKGKIERIEVKETINEVEKLLNMALDHDASVKSLASDDSNE